MKFRYKNVLVYGLSVSGEWAAKLLRKCRSNVYLYDDNQEVLENVKIKGCYVLNGLNENLISQFDCLIVSPSIEYDNEHLVLARENGVKIYSEVEFASLFSKNFVAVTGTNGKTTTVQIITKLLQAKCKAIACGNIGFPMSRAVLESKKSVKVVEVSSFMLENCKELSPKVATVTNIEQDHIIRHKTIEEYVRLKNNIFKNLTIKDYAVVNLDLNIHPKKDCKIITYSYSHNADVYVRNGAIYLHNEKILNLNELQIKGKHNIYNVMCAICFAYIYKVKIKKIRNVLINLKADKYRIERLGSVNGINFINDSKSTNLSSTLAAVESVKGGIILLMGGSDKGLDYKKLFSSLSKRVKEIVVFGQIANQLETENQKNFPLTKFETLKESFDYAVNIALKNDTILLSPATASYDQYKNYIERGKAFNAMVKEYETLAKKK